MTFNHGVRSSNLRWVTKFFQKITEKQFLGVFFAYESRKCYESGQTFRGRRSVTGLAFRGLHAFWLFSPQKQNMERNDDENRMRLGT